MFTIQVSKILGALFVGLLVLLFGVIISRLTNRSFLFPTIGVLVLLCMQAFWETSIYAMTEPLYLTCYLAGFICLDNYSTTRKQRWLLIAAVLLGLAFLARYIGISAILAGLLFILFQNNARVKRKLLDLFILGSISVIPMLIWLIRNKLLAGSATNRGVHFVPITPQEWKSTYETLMTWVEPVRASITINLIYLIILLVALAISFLIFRRREFPSEQTATQLPRLLALYGVTYILLTIISRLWGDPSIPLSEYRILFPFMTSLFFLVLFGLHLFLNFIRKRSSLLAVFLTSILVIIAWSFISSNPKTTFPYVRPVLPVLQSHYGGLGLQYRDYLAEDFLKVIAQLPEDALFFTNNVEKLYFFTQRSSSYIGDLTANDIEVLKVQLSNSEVVVVFMGGPLENQQTLQRQIPQFQLVYSDDSGIFVLHGRSVP